MNYVFTQRLVLVQTIKNEKFSGISCGNLWIFINKTNQVLNYVSGFIDGKRTLKQTFVYIID